MKNRPAIALYGLLILVAVISMSYYLAGAVALREEFFHPGQYVREPFDFRPDGQTVTALQKEATVAGVSDKDVVVSINGVPFEGQAQLLFLLRHLKPGDTLRLMVRTPHGQARSAQIRVAPREPPGFSLGGYIAFLTPVLGVPLLGLLIGYWIVAARPRDLNAWLVLMLLTFPATAFGNLDWTFWPNPWFTIFGVWHVWVQVVVFAALLWFGVYFPERWRLDRRWPYAKWLILAISLALFAIQVRVEYALGFAVRTLPSLLPLDAWSDRIYDWFSVICIVLFLIALFDKYRSASTSDARRRLRVLAMGSALSLGPLVLIFAVTPLFGMDPHRGNWFAAVAPFIALFPLTLAYVLIVQRAMDVRILLRIGTRYLLARVTLIILEFGLAAFVILRFILPMMQRKQHQALNLLLLTVVIAVFFRVFVMRDSLSSRLQRWLDRKFFREAYNTEVVLSELSEEARKLTDKRTLIDTVLRRISEILHVPHMAVWLRGSKVFHLQQAVGMDWIGTLVLPEDSVTVQNLMRTNRPATLYRDRPEEWFTSAPAEEKSVLREINAELLLPLPGRARLMGLMALGPKRSEEPYTPTDLRVLQSVAAQTGLTLEIAELVQSLANEAAQRERINREIEIAREVQERLFPQSIPQIAGVSLAGMCRPALQVGGDYYDFLELDDGRIGLAIGDVSGKGISAALIMASLRASLRGLALDGPGDLSHMMDKVNRLVYEASSSSRYATFFFATYDSQTRVLQYVNAGHNPPMLIRVGSNEVVRLEAGGLVVGLLPSAKYEAQSITLQPGDLLILYTDGISEAMTAADEEWGEDRLLAATPLSCSITAAQVITSIFSAADEFTAGAEQHDDMTLLIMKLAA